MWWGPASAPLLPEQSNPRHQRSSPCSFSSLRFSPLPPFTVWGCLTRRRGGSLNEHLKKSRSVGASVISCDEGVFQARLSVEDLSLEGWWRNGKSSPGPCAKLNKRKRQKSWRIMSWLLRWWWWSASKRHFFYLCSHRVSISTISTQVEAVNTALIWATWRVNLIVECMRCISLSRRALSSK